MERSPPTGASLPDTDLATDVAPEVPNPAAGGLLARVAYGLGGLGLLAATATDALAVAGRHLGFRLLGSIELVQAAVVLLGASAMLIATIVGSHAAVHMVTERLSPRAADRLGHATSLVSALVFLALALGSAWVASDLWNGFEQTELLHLPLRWLRALWIVFALLIAARFLRNAFKAPAP
jgi:TRAP-type C4-dicarboxylate transport system permease small subunit